MAGYTSVTDILSMAAQRPHGHHFNIRIAALIAEVEACLQHSLPAGDRESRLQREAFRERCHQARKLAERLATAGEHEWSLSSGDAHRIHRSLQHSLAYFRTHKPD